VVLHDNGKKLMAERNGRVVLISLNHTQEHATAVAILESV
jgi:phosphopantetheinyl transferase (holo-ACP synthase)